MLLFFSLSWASAETESCEMLLDECVSHLEATNREMMNVVDENENLKSFSEWQGSLITRQNVLIMSQNEFIKTQNQQINERDNRLRETRISFDEYEKEVGRTIRNERIRAYATGAGASGIIFFALGVFSGAFVF